MLRTDNDWGALLEPEFQREYYAKLSKFIKTEYESGVIYPKIEHVFAFLESTTHHQVKVVLLGQDPYPQAGLAHGLAFSVPLGIKIPRSLRNIYQELQSDLQGYIPNNGCLAPWAEQGVLLLNTALTVRANAAGSHRGSGWEAFTDKIIELVNEKSNPVVFLLWGNEAKNKARLITKERHLILTAAHPSPLSARRGFFGCRHFSKCNDFLRRTGQAGIEWQIPNV
ncbi:MAG: uracil-DNA glycosylase [Peptococcaceae bacterium]|nr:uracil-DNA glycosylase [Peptococcaceae bacterium]